MTFGCYSCLRPHHLARRRRAAPRATGPRGQYGVVSVSIQLQPVAKVVGPNHRAGGNAQRGEGRGVAADAAMVMYSQQRIYGQGTKKTGQTKA